MDKIFIPDDIFYYLTHFLTPIDCMSFSLSGVSNRFTSFYLRRGSWRLRLCHCLTPIICQRFFSNSLVASTVQVLDLSHCFWLPEASLLGCLSALENLKELNVLDTELSLTSLILNVIPKCKYLIKLAVNIAEQTWDEFNFKLLGSTERYRDHFQKLTHLRFYVLNSSSPFIWVLLFNVLGWCRDCIQLDLELFQSGMVRQECPWDRIDSSAVVTALSRKKLYENMKWMVSLKALSVRNKVSDRCLDDFCRWFFFELKPPGLEKLWLPSIKSVSSSTWRPTPTVTILHFGQLGSQRNVTFESQNITHLAGVVIGQGLKFPQLRFLRGNFMTFSALDEFCQSHPQLEHLHLDGQEVTFHEETITFQCQWVLARLRTLVFASNDPHPDILKKFMDSCSNLEELHVGLLLTYSIFLSKRPVHEVYRSIAKQKHLRKLTLSGLEFTQGAFFQQIFQSCNRLEKLHIAGQFEDDVSFFQDLCRFLPLASNLRDLRIQREEIGESVLFEILSSAGSCPLLERFVIHQETWSVISPALLSVLPGRLVELINIKLPRLVAFSLVYPLDVQTIETISDQLNKLIMPNRPSFWFYLGDTLPRDTTMPRIHLDEIVDPREYIDSFPAFI